VPSIGLNLNIGRRGDKLSSDSLRDFASRFSSLPIEAESRKLAEEHIAEGAIGSDYPEDSLHIAIATLNEMDYILSWNFRHIVRMKTRRVVDIVNLIRGYSDIEIVSPAGVT